MLSEGRQGAPGRSRTAGGPRPDRRAEAAAPAGLPARQAAFGAVAEVLRSGVALDDALARTRTVSDDPLVRAIAVATFRHLGSLGRVLQTRLSRGLSEDERAFALLATGAAQILHLQVADHAAVSLTVEIARRDPTLGHLAGLANAVLRRVVREREAILAEAVPALVEAPVWLAERWVAHYGADRAEAIALAHRDGAPVDVTVRDDPEGWAERLGGAVLPTGSVRLASRTAVPDLPGFEDGAWWVQDAAAALPARLLDVRPGERVLDMCAAPGGKTAQLAAAGGRVTALDRSGPRLQRLADNMARLRLEVEAIRADALAFRAEAFDAVLLDAPCTATGTLRRHPDVAWTKQRTDLASLADLQRRLLDKAAALTRPGGRLVYCVCSLEPEEGGEQVAAFLARQPDFERVAVDPAALGLRPDASSPAGDLRTLPDGLAAHPGVRGGLDGFFAAHLSRKQP